MCQIKMEEGKLFYWRIKGEDILWNNSETELNWSKYIITVSPGKRLICQNWGRHRVKIWVGSRAYENYRLNYFDALPRSLNWALKQPSLPRTSWCSVPCTIVFIEKENGRARTCLKYSSLLNVCWTQTMCTWFTGATGSKFPGQICTGNWAYSHELLNDQDIFWEMHC